MMKSNQNKGRRFSMGRVIGAIMATLLVCGALVACGGPQPPPSEGNCHPWREWVPPHQDDDGEWHSGYCRDRD